MFRGIFPPIIRSSMTAVAASGFTFVSWWQSCCVRGRAGWPDHEHGELPETCWAANKRQNNKVENCFIWSVIWIVQWCMDLQTIKIKRNAYVASKSNTHSSHEDTWNCLKCQNSPLMSGQCNTGKKTQRKDSAVARVPTFNRNHLLNTCINNCYMPTCNL
jgi:hypothetical protein